MTAWTLALTASLGLSAAALLGRVALGIVRRESTDDLRVARNAHALGWAMLATMVASDALRVALALPGDPAHAGYLALVYVKILAASAAFAGFGLFVLTIWVGRTLWIELVTFLAILHGATFVWLTTQRLPFDVTVGTWATRIVFLSPSGGLPQAVALVLFFVPTALVAFGYLFLLPRLADRTHRLRVLLVAVAVIAFQTAGIVQSNPDVDPDGPLVPTFTAFLLVAALLAHLAYFPPQPWRSRWGLRGIDEENQANLPQRRRSLLNGS